MVERIPKVQSDQFRLQRKDKASDDHSGGGQEEQQEEEKDEFGAKADFSKWTGDKDAGAQRQPSLWERQPSAGQTRETGLGESMESQLTEKTPLEEMTGSTTMTFLRAAGLITIAGSPRWGMITLYTLSFIGFLVAFISVMSALL